MELRELITFITVADTLNYTKASEIMYSSNSATSKHITKLEAELGVQLFERDSHSVVLTPKGEEFLAQVRPAIGLIDHAFKELKESKCLETKQYLHIGYDEVLSFTYPVAGWITDHFIRYSELNPDVKLIWVPMRPSELAKVMQTGTLDLLLEVDDNPFDTGGMASLRILQDPMMLVFPRSMNCSSLQETAARCKKAFLPSSDRVYPTALRLFSELECTPDIYLLDGILETVYNVANEGGMTLLPKRVYASFQMEALDAIPTSVETGVNVRWNALRQNGARDRLLQYIRSCE